ncbi:hypothetical protein A2U01_0108025, partial [Trifolium medium]|nr:hypothetical protein [Trifolium medium]
MEVAGVMAGLEDGNPGGPRRVRRPWISSDTWSWNDYWETMRLLMEAARSSMEGGEAMINE